MTSFSVDLRQQNLKATVDENIEKDPNETYNAFFDKFSHTRDSHMPLVEKKFNRKKGLYKWLGDSKVLDQMMFTWGQIARVGNSGGYLAEWGVRGGQKFQT